MPLHDDKPRIIASLKKIPGISNVVPAFPREFTKRPIIAITEAANRPVQFRDDREYLTQLQYMVRVFAHTEEEISRISSHVEDIMTITLDYVRVGCWQDDSGQTRQRVITYSTNM